MILDPRLDHCAENNQEKNVDKGLHKTTIDENSGAVVCCESSMPLKTQVNRPYYSTNSFEPRSEVEGEEMPQFSQKSNTTKDRVETEDSASKLTSFPPSQKSKYVDDSKRAATDALTNETLAEKRSKRVTRKYVLAKEVASIWRSVDFGYELSKF